MKPSKTKFIILAVCIAAAIYTSWAVGVQYECATLTIDLSVQETILNLRGGISDIVAIFITHLGDTKTIIMLCIALLFIPKTRTKYGLPVTVSALAGLAIYKPMKHIFLRARPDEVLHMVEQGGYSFPSGHSVSALIVYGLLAYLIRKHCKNPVLKNVLSVICGVLSIAIGLSRIYVGVHWPTDVFAGLAIGGAVLMFVTIILDRLIAEEK